MNSKENNTGTADGARRHPIDVFADVAHELTCLRAMAEFGNHAADDSIGLTNEPRNLPRENDIIIALGEISSRADAAMALVSKALAAHELVGGSNA